MEDFITIIQSILEEKGKTTENLFNDNIISRDTFYKYEHRNPSLKSLKW